MIYVTLAIMLSDNFFYFRWDLGIWPLQQSIIYVVWGIQNIQIRIYDDRLRASTAKISTRHHQNVNDASIFNWLLSQVLHCIWQIFHNCPKYAHFYYKMVYSEIWDWRIVGLMQQVSQSDKSDWLLIGYDLFINDQSAQNSNNVHELPYGTQNTHWYLYLWMFISIPFWNEFSVKKIIVIKSIFELMRISLYGAQSNKGDYALRKPNTCGKIASWI